MTHCLLDVGLTCLSVALVTLNTSIMTHHAKYTADVPRIIPEEDTTERRECADKVRADGDWSFDMSDIGGAQGMTVRHLEELGMKAKG
jgi:hypothetical protein